MTKSHLAMGAIGPQLIPNHPQLNANLHPNVGDMSQRLGESVYISPVDDRLTKGSINCQKRKVKVLSPPEISIPSLLRY
jgi:hypothetical protein